MLADYALPDKFDTALNQCLERIHSEGQWPGGKVTMDVSAYVEDGILTLPYEYETMIGLSWQGSARLIVDANAEFIPAGAGIQTALEGNGTIIDLGMVPVGDEGDYQQLLHQYKLTFQYAAGQELTAMLRRRFVYLRDENDYVYPAHLGALKNGLLAVRFEDEGDLERASGYWTRCFDFLNSASAQTRVGSRQVLGGQFNFGAAGNKSFY
jgi:hypothetical protein